MRSRLVHVLMITLLYGQGAFGLIAIAAVVTKPAPVVSESLTPGQAPASFALAGNGDVAAR